MLADITHGHAGMADWLFLVAAILFVLAGLIAATQRPDPGGGSLIPAGLALVAIGLLVL